MMGRAESIFVGFRTASGYAIYGEHTGRIGEVVMAQRLALLFSALLAIPAAAQDKPKPIAAHPKVDQEKVDAAIQAGCKYLLGAGGMGTFTHGQRNQPEAIQSYAELTLLTLLHS